MTAPVKCPHCGLKIEFKIAGLKADPLFTCPACHKQTQIDSRDSLLKAADELAKLDSAWSNLKRSAVRVGAVFGAT